MLTSFSFSGLGMETWRLCLSSLTLSSLAGTLWHRDPDCSCVGEGGF